MQHMLPQVASAQPVRVVLYSHDSQGLGHVRRNLSIAHHIARHFPKLTGRPVAGLLVSGLPYASTFPLPEGFDWVFIPSIHKAEGAYASRSLNASTKHLIGLRSQLLHACLLGFNPDLVIIDRHIFGVMRELQTPLITLRQRNPEVRVVLGLREVLDAPEVAHAEWFKHGDPQNLRHLIDAIWVYGDRKVHNPVVAGEVPECLADLVRFTGYLAQGRELTEVPTDPGLTTPFILSTAGGGSDGYQLLQTLVRTEVPDGYQHLVVAGPQLNNRKLLKLQAKAVAGTRVVGSLPGLSGLMEQAAAVISMGGYNSVNEILATDTPALIVPRETPRTEQLIRARALQKVVAVDLLQVGNLTSALTGAWLAQAVGSRVDRSGIKRNGLTKTAKLAAETFTITYPSPQEEACTA